jgi:hypothetical protein
MITASWRRCGEDGTVANKNVGGLFLLMGRAARLIIYVAPNLAPVINPTL